MYQRNLKPLGLILIIIYSAMAALMSFFGGGLVLIASAIPGIPLWVPAFGLISILVAVFLMAAVYGLWTLQEWGFRFALIIYCISIPLGVVAIFPLLPGAQFSIGNTLFQLLGVGIDVFVLWYLTGPNVALLRVYN